MAVVADVLALSFSDLRIQSRLRGSQWSSESPLRLILPSDWDGGIEPENEAKRRLMEVTPDERLLGEKLPCEAEIQSVKSRTFMV